MIKEDLSCSPALLTFGTTLWLPGDFACHDAPTLSKAFALKLKTAMSRIAATPTKQPTFKAYVQKFVSDAKLVFVCHDMVRKLLQAPYDGPFRVIQKHFLLDVNGKEDRISIDRLKIGMILSSDTQDQEWPSLTREHFGASTKGSGLFSNISCQRDPTQLSTIGGLGHC